jgi:hypothetical protein
MPTTVRAIADISVTGASRTNGHTDARSSIHFRRLPDDVFATDRSRWFYTGLWLG